MVFHTFFSRHICSIIAETIGVTNYAVSFGAKSVQKTAFGAAEMMLSPWNQQMECILLRFPTYVIGFSLEGTVKIENTRISN